MSILQQLLNWTASVAWPIVTLVALSMFRRPIFSLLERIGSIADRASREAIDIQVGEKFKLSFKEAIQKADPKTVAEAIAVAEKEADKAFTIFELLARVPLRQHHMDLLLKVAKGGDEGIHWIYKGAEAHAPGRTMGYLLNQGLVRRAGDRYVAHPVIRDYIFGIHGGNDA